MNKTVKLVCWFVSLLVIRYFGNFSVAYRQTTLLGHNEHFGLSVALYVLGESV